MKYCVFWSKLLDSTRGLTSSYLQTEGWCLILGVSMAQCLNIAALVASFEGIKNSFVFFGGCRDCHAVLPITPNCLSEWSRHSCNKHLELAFRHGHTISH